MRISAGNDERGRYDNGSGLRSGRVTIRLGPARRVPGRRSREGPAIIIALFGIMNTLGLSIFEGVRELRLLRAVGAPRAQLRAMIRWEAVIIAILGAVLGLAVGLFFGWTVVRASRGIGITAFTLDSGQLALFVVAAALAGILAAILPRRRAARVDMLWAISTAYTRTMGTRGGIGDPRIRGGQQEGS